MSAPVRTPDEAYQAGAAAARDHPPLDDAQVTAVALLLAACQAPKVKAA